jgi:hypothetical protein
MISCATPSSPDGGPRDERAPRIIEEKSSQLFQTNVNEKNWVFEFDEFVKLNNPNQNILISPPLRFPIDVRTKGKKVQLRFDDREELEENTTYIINFGKAIQDITEGNIARGLKHVFSTGPVIDSLSISGSIVSAFDYEPVLDAVVLLYDQREDSIVLKEKPSYLTFPDSSGRFKLDYLRSDSFWIYVIQDDNLNLFYDGPPEKIGFLEEGIILDSNLFLSLPFVLFEEESNPLVDDYKFQSGKLEVQLSRPILDTPQIELTGISVFESRFLENQLLVWYQGEPENNNFLIFDYGEIRDTNRLRYLKSQDLPRPSGFIQSSPITCSADGKVLLKFDAPVMRVDSSKFRFLHDTLVYAPGFYHLKDQFTIQIQADERIKEKGGMLVLDSAAVLDFRENVNDSIAIQLRPFNEEKTGNIFLSVEDLDPEKQYKIELTHAKSDWINSWMVYGDTISMDTFNYVLPGVYEITVIEDLDRNGRWSSGKLIEKTMPENVFKKALEELKANWNLDAQVIVKFEP